MTSNNILHGDLYLFVNYLCLQELPFLQSTLGIFPSPVGNAREVAIGNYLDGVVFFLLKYACSVLQYGLKEVNFCKITYFALNCLQFCQVM